MNPIVITSNDLLSKNNFIAKNGKELSANNFWYYTTLDTANKILDNKCIHVSNLSNMNDVDEIKLHEKEKDFVHCLCLCNSNTEKIPMWYLYSGIAGQGVSLGFTPSVMLNFINEIDKVTTVDKSVILHKGIDFELDYGWIFYRKNNYKSQVLYKGKWYSLKDPDKFEKDNFFIKAYPWEYEKEFRIIIRNITSTSYDKLIIDIEPIYNKLKLRLAPELSNNSYEEIIHNLSGFSKYFLTVLKKSDLSINMKLFDRNFESFIDYLKSNSIDNNIDCSKICDAISNNCKLMDTKK